MMAEIEEHEGDVGRARQWMGRALNAAPDPAWTADGYVSTKWLPVSPVTGRLDAFQWKVPLAELSPPGRFIDEAPPLREAPAEPAPPPAEPEAATPAPPPSPHPAAAPSSPPPSSAPAAHKAAPLPAIAPRRDRESDDAVIPLVPSPDDPGPDGDLPPEPTPEPPRHAPWWRALFR